MQYKQGNTLFMRRVKKPARGDKNSFVQREKKKFAPAFA